MNYKDWLESQNDVVKLDILGPSRFKAYKTKDLEITSFVKDGRVLTLEELGIDRVIRDEAVNAMGEDDYIFEGIFTNVYKEDMTSIQLHDKFRERHPDIVIELSKNDKYKNGNY